MAGLELLGIDTEEADDHTIPPNAEGTGDVLLVGLADGDHRVAPTPEERALIPGARAVHAHQVCGVGRPGDGSRETCGAIVVGVDEIDGFVQELLARGVVLFPAEGDHEQVSADLSNLLAVLARVLGHQDHAVATGDEPLRQAHHMAFHAADPQAVRCFDYREWSLHRLVSRRVRVRSRF